MYKKFNSQHQESSELLIGYWCLLKLVQDPDCSLKNEPSNNRSSHPLGVL